MSAELVNVSNGILTVRFSGELKPAEWQAVQEAAADAIEKNGKVSLLCLAEDFGGWAKAGGWGDISFQAKYDSFIEKIAIVGDRKWEDLTLLFTSKGIRPMPIEYFSPEHIEKARAWLNAPPERS